MSAPLNATILHEGAGIVVTGIDVELSQAVDWSALLRTTSAHLVMNLDGHAVILGLQIRLGIVPGTASLLRPAEGETIHASRLPGGGRHRFIVLSATSAWLAANFGDSTAALHPALHPRREVRARPGGVRPDQRPLVAQGSSVVVRCSSIPTTSYQSPAGIYSA